MRASLQTFFTQIRFSHTETMLLIGYSFILGFLLSFNNWGEPFSYATGISNLVLSSILALFVTFVFIFGQKAMGFFLGVNIESIVSWKSLIVSVMLIMASKGALIFFLPPRVVSHLKPFHMIGRRPYQFSVKHLSAMALFAVGLMSLVAILAMNSPFSVAIRSDIFLLCFLTALYALIPIEFFLTIFHFMIFHQPKEYISGHVSPVGESAPHVHPVSLGSLLLYGSRTRYVFAILLLAASSVALFTTGIIFSILFAFFVAVLGMIVYFIKQELEYV